MATARPPELAIELTTCTSASCRRPTATTAIPRPASRVAAACPMPEPAPVTMATLSSDAIGTFLFSRPVVFLLLSSYWLLFGVAEQHLGPGTARH